MIAKINYLSQCVTNTVISIQLITVSVMIPVGFNHLTEAQSLGPNSGLLAGGKLVQDQTHIV